MQKGDFLIEELSGNDVTESELAEFTETKPIKVLDIILPKSEPVGETSPASSSNGSKVGRTAHTLNAEGEAALIKRFLRGEGDFPEHYTTLDSGDEEDDDVDKVEREAQEHRKHGFSKLLATQTTAQAAEEKEAESKQIDTSLSDAGGLRHSAGNTSGSGSSSVKSRRTILNAALQGLMGEANLSFARGQLDVAEKICLEIIRHNPMAAEPFFTLAEIYETRDIQKHMYFLTIAAHLDPHDRDQWIRIADLHAVNGNPQRARIFYTKAIKANPKDYDLRLRKARLLEQMNEKHNSMLTYLHMIPHIPATEVKLCLTVAKDVARHFHGISKHAIALEAMDTAYRICGTHFTLEDLNLYMDLLIFNKSYSLVLRCLREHTALELETQQESDLELIFFCVIPDDFIPDFRAKLCVCLIHMHANHLLGYLIQNLHEHMPVSDERLDLYIDIAEALMQEHKYAEAIELLRPVINSDIFECPAFVWLRQAECLRNLNRTDEAIETYTRLVELAPFCYEAKFTLSAMLKQQGRHAEAAKALEQSGECDGQPLNARLLYERCLMLQQMGALDEFLEVGYALLARHSLKLRNRQELLAAVNGFSLFNIEGIKVILQMRNIADNTEIELQEYTRAPQENFDLTIHDEYNVFLELLRSAFQSQKFAFIERLCFSMVTTKRFTPYHPELEHIIILATYFNDDCSVTFSYLRELITKNTNNMAYWNFFSLLVQKGHDLRYQRYVRRLTQRHITERKIRIFIGHYHLYCISHKYALNIYVPLFKENPTSILALCIAVVFNQMSAQRKILRKTAAAAQAIAFAQKYATLRVGEHWNATTKASSVSLPSSSSSFSKQTKPVQCSNAAEQEICYNFGRIYHQAGLTHLAVEYYERGLAASHSVIDENEEYLGLRQEIAYNLHLIYKAAGNVTKARHYLYEYCVV